MGPRVSVLRSLVALFLGHHLCWKIRHATFQTRDDLLIKPSYVNDWKNFVSDSLPSVALREIRREFSKKPAVLAVLGAGLILGLSGPFNTIELLGTGPRIIYWVAIAFGTYAVGVGAGAGSKHLFRPKSPVADILLSSLAIGLSVSLFLIAFNWTFVGFVPDTVPELLRLVAEVFVISAIITTGLSLAGSSAMKGAVTESPPPLLDRLPFEKRGALVSLSATDHYVNVVTDKGQEMILMRLADAIREVGVTKGGQVHRSHWVAFDQVVSVQRAGDGAQLTMSMGQIIPVSRANMPAIRDAGLLVKR